MTTTPGPLYPIGDVARRTGLAVSAIRFYADEGLVEPADVSPGGHRLYDVDAIARLELVRTLRDLGAGLDQVRRLLAGETTLRYLLAEHLELVEAQERDLRVRRAVLRALVREDDPTDRVALMRRLVTMPDAERERLVDEFWREVSADLPPDVADRLGAEPPRLPDDPTVEQLEAWIELAELVQDTEFRRAVRAYLHDTYATGPGAEVSAPHVQEWIATAAQDLTPRIVAAFRSGLAPDDPHARALAVQLLAETTATLGTPADGALWERMADGFAQVGEVYDDALHDPGYEASHGRYLRLAAVINGTPDPGSPAGDPATADVDMGALGRWLSAAMRGAAPDPRRS